SGSRTIAWYMSALHQVDVFDRDRAAVAIVRHQKGKADRRLGGRHGQHQERVDLADEVADMGREGHQIDVHGEQDQLDRHQDDDDVLAVEKDAEDPEREQDGGNREIVPEPDGHRRYSPCPGRTCRISMAVSLLRAICWAALWRFTPSL